MINTHEQQYLELLKDVLDNGVQKSDRTGTGTRSIFHRHMRFDLSDHSIPLLTTKKIHWNSIIHELLWYIAGDTNVKYLQDNGVRIWNEWAKDNGDLGPVYGKQWRDWERVTGAKINYEMDPPRPELITERIDQLANAIDKLKNNPDDRRMIVNSWNVGQLDDMQLPPCHYTYQFYSAPMSEYERERVLYKSDRYDGIEQVPTRKVSCKMTQRSCDVFLGVPFNIAQYSILTHMIAQVTGHHPGEFIWDGGDVHLYDNHVEQAKTQLGRDAFEAPRLALDPNIEGIDDFSFDSFELIGYNSHNTIKAKVAV